MKKIFYLMFLVLLAFSCSKPKEMDPIFGNPDERISDTLLYVKKTLVDAPYGWKAYTTTEISKGGYGFYMQFDKNDRLRMIADLNKTTASEAKESTYRIRQIMYATLSFDTYNYITMLQDPDPSVYGGLPGRGHGSDNEYDYVKTHGDTLFFQGRKFIKPLVLVKATAEEQTAYLSKKLLASINDVDAYFENGINIVMLNKANCEFTLNTSAKQVNLMAMIDGKVESVQIPYCYNLDKNMTLLSDSTFDGERFSKITESNGVYTLHALSGKTFVIKKSNDYLLPPQYKLGTAITDMFQPGVYSYASYLPLKTWSASYMVDWNEYVRLSKTGGYGLTVGDSFYNFNDAKKVITMDGYIYQGNTRFIGGYVMNYSIDLERGTIRFLSIKNTTNNGGIMVPYMNATFFKKMINHDFKLSFITDEDFGSGIQFTSVEDPNYYFSFAY
ncbi:DUF4302 domain-containing protein [Sphingobacterium multivorum]|uniref:DUF4302 domain-containing protein n=1 Tax=Sphingobacterium multivorum TaxID=28454 RepID=UPI003DA29FF8